MHVARAFGMRRRLNLAKVSLWKAHSIAWTLLLAFTMATVAPPMRSVHAQQNAQGNQGNRPAVNRLVVPVSGTVGGVANTLTGTFAISRFARTSNRIDVVVA